MSPMPRVVRGLLAFLVLALPLGVLAGAGAVSALRQLDRSRDAAVDRTTDAVAALLTENSAALRREAVALASDPALAEGTAKGDGGTVVRWASTRLLAVTRDGLADLLVLRDARGAPLVQVPAFPPSALPALAPPSVPLLTLQMVGSRPYLLAVAPVASVSASEEASRAPAGVVVLGRRFEALGRVLDTLPSRPSVVAVTGDVALASTRADLPADGWTEATRNGRLRHGTDTFVLRALDHRRLGIPEGSLWAVVSESEFALARRQLWLWLVALASAAAIILAAGGYVLSRGGKGREPRAEDSARRAELERRNRELEARSEE